MTEFGDRASQPNILERWGRGSTAVVLSLFAVAVLLVGVTLGYVVRGSADGSPNSLVSVTPADDSIEVGFARDMIVHHNQGVTMAHEAEAHTADPEMRLLAYDINATQLAQVGQMQGWMALWQRPEQLVGNPHRMAWMGAGGKAGEKTGVMTGMATTGTSAGSSSVAEQSTAEQSPAGQTGADATADDSGHQALMPGMATSGEMSKLKSLRGKDSDVYVLQLMIRHHQGGAAMMVFAATHAANPIVANFAQQMWQSQTGELSVMTQMLAARGAKPLPFNAGK